MRRALRDFLFAFGLAGAVAALVFFGITGLRVVTAWLVNAPEATAARFFKGLYLTAGGLSFFCLVSVIYQNIRRRP